MFDRCFLVHKFALLYLKETTARTDFILLVDGLQMEEKLTSVLLRCQKSEAFSKKMHWCIFFSKEENFDNIDKSNRSLEDVKHVKLPLGVGIVMNYGQR